MTHPLPDDPLKLMSLTGALCSDLGLHDRALAIFQHLVVVRDQDPNALVSLALAESRAGDDGHAIATLRRAIERDPAHDMARTMLAIHLHRAGDASGRSLLQAVLDDATDPDARALAESVREELQGPTPAAASTPATTAKRPGRHRYTRLSTQP